MIQATNWYLFFWYQINKQMQNNKKKIHFMILEFSIKYGKKEGQMD